MIPQQQLKQQPILHWVASWEIPLLPRCPLSGDDDFDDNPDDSYASKHTHYSRILAVSCLFRGYARSWQCGGQGFESP